MEKAAVIFNPAAGQGRLEQSIEAIQKKLESAFESVTLYRTEQPGDGSEYVKKIGHEVDVIIAAGGDGTVHEIAGAVCSLEIRPVFGVIPGGTCNDFSRAIGLDQNPIQAAEQIAKRTVKQIEVGHTGDGYFLNFWGIGLITQVSSQINENTKDSFGRLAYYISAAQNLKNPASFHVKMESDHYSYDGEAVMILVGNGPFTGGVRVFFPRIDMADGKVDVLLIKEASLPMIWSILRSKTDDALPHEDENIVYFRTKRVEIETDPQQKVDCDGERSGHTPVVISTLPEHLNVLVGENDQWFSRTAIRE
ncbi:MAG TPA: diacylglycerol kinase family protein [Bacillales bacterium]|nr:diacylglycerol kinase family protein [Bacillales bacterium]